MTGAPVALSDTLTVLTVVVAYLVLLAVFLFARAVLRHGPPSWRRYRFGFFIERDPDPGDDDR